MNIAPGLIIGFFGTLIGIIYYCCCRCCNCCNIRTPRPEGYSTCERCAPAVATILLGLACAYVTVT